MNTTMAVTETRPATQTYLQIDTPTKKTTATTTGDDSQELLDTTRRGKQNPMGSLLWIITTRRTMHARLPLGSPVTHSMTSPLVSRRP